MSPGFTISPTLSERPRRRDEKAKGVRKNQQQDRRKNPETVIRGNSRQKV